MGTLTIPYTIPDALAYYHLPPIESIVGKRFTFHCGQAMYSGEITGISIASDSSGKIALEISNKHFWWSEPGVILTKRYDILYLQFAAVTGLSLIYQTAQYLPQGKLSIAEARDVNISFFEIID